MATSRTGNADEAVSDESCNELYKTPAGSQKRPMKSVGIVGTKTAVLSFSLYYMYIRDNGIFIGHYGHFGDNFQICFDVLAVRSEVQTQW